MSDILSILTTISFVPSADDAMDPEEDKEEKWTPFPSQKGKQRDKSETKTKESMRVKLTSFMSMVFRASARTTTFTLFLPVVLLIEDRDFCTTSFPRYPPKLDDDIVVVVVVVNELAAANIVVVVKLLLLLLLF